VNNSDNPTFLVVEDRDDDLFMIQRAFQQLGFDTPVQYLKNGEEAIAYLKGAGRYANREQFPLPSVLLLDLKMPRKNGFEVLEWIQQQPSLTDLRTVVLTTSEDVYELHRVYRLGAASFLTKPLNFTEFKDTIHVVYNYWMMLNRPPSLQRPQKGTVVPPPLTAVRQDTPPASQ
jgi:CheY-like chemotaxis protein